MQTAKRLVTTGPNPAHEAGTQRTLQAPPPLPDGRIRLAYLVPPSAQFAGIERVVHEVAGTLARDYRPVLDVTVISCSRYPGVTPDIVPYRLLYLDVARLRGLIGPLRALLRRETFDVLVAAQCETSALAWLALRLGQRKGTTLLVPHLHGNPAIEERKSAINRVLFALYRRFAAPASAAILAVAGTLADRVRVSTLAGGRPVRFAPNPARLFADTRSSRRPNDPPVFVSVGRLSRQKGHDVLLRAFALVLDRWPAARLDLVGDGEEAASLKELANDLRIAERVAFHGHVADPSPFLRQASAFVLASRWEGFPLALVEALSFGLPLVATACEFGPPDLVDEDWIGRLAPVENAPAFAGAMLASLAIERDEIADERRRLRAARHAPAAVARVHANILADILASERGPTAASLLAARLRRGEAT